MSMKRSLAKMVTAAMQRQQQRKQQARETDVAGKQEPADSEKSQAPADVKPMSAELATTRCSSSGPAPRFSPPPADFDDLLSFTLSGRASEELLCKPFDFQLGGSTVDGQCVAERRRYAAEQLEKDKAYEALVAELEKRRVDLMLRDQRAQARIAELEAEVMRMAVWTASLRGVADRSSIEVLHLRNYAAQLQSDLAEAAGRLQRVEVLRVEVLDALGAVQKRLAACSETDIAHSALLVDEVLEKVRTGLD